MKKLLATMIVLFLAAPIGAADLTVTVPSTAVANAVEMCDIMRVQMRVRQSNWSNDICAGEFLRRGLRLFTANEKKKEVQKDLRIEINTAVRDFDTGYPVQAVLAVCGDSITDTEFGEECDDGNEIDGDGCDDCSLT